LAVGAPQLAQKQRRRELLIETINGQPAAQSPWAKGLLAAGARIDYRGLVVRGMVPIASVPAPEPEPEPEPDDELADA
ncbi:MAG TPA: hypothetical protein VFQ65_13575, partial [Kofleriaceae bacterium]|nr:hypothetical protein [Kofleriaceae bacterium]